MLDVLPPLPPPPVLDPRPGDWPALRTRAGRRQRARYAAAGGAVSFAAAVALVLAGPVGGPASLRIEEPAGKPTAERSTAAAAAGPGSPVLPPSGLPVPGLLPGASASEEPRPQRPTPTGTHGGPGPSSSESPAPKPQLRPATSGYVRTDVAYTESSETCDYPGFDWALWCFRQLEDPYTARSGETRDYSFEVCRLPGSRAGTMTFSSTQEFSFGVFGGEDGQTWSWETGRRFTQPGPTVLVGDGRCARWTVTWQTVDDAGRALRPGAYDGSVSIHARYSGSVTTTSVTRGFDLEVTS